VLIIGSIYGGIEIHTDILNVYDSHRIDDDVKVYCEECRGEMSGEGLANRGICPACGGRPVGIRFCRNPLTRKILYAERIEQ
jgi:Zn finger protein HypA/HybF involved in hydrogenase expression